MRRSLLCLALTVLAVGIVLRFNEVIVPEKFAAAQGLPSGETSDETSKAKAKKSSTSDRGSNTPIRVANRIEELGDRPADFLESRLDRSAPYPVFNVNEVLDHLMASAAKLHRAGKTKGDVELRKQMNRATAKLDLPEPLDEVISDRELYRRACESVFIVCSLYKLDDSGNWQTSLATAFAVTNDGVLTTSCHVFDNDDEADVVVVMDLHRKVYPVRELLAVNQQSDTCLFRIDGKNLKPLPFAHAAPPGTPVRVLGHPGDSFYFLSSGLVSNYEKDHEGTTWLNTTADFGQGSSGGPVMDDCGNVVGQVSRTFTLYAGGPATRGRPRRVAGAVPVDDRDRKLAEKADPAIADPETDVPDPQMVFKACVPVRTLRALCTAE